MIVMIVRDLRSFARDLRSIAGKYHVHRPQPSRDGARSSQVRRQLSEARARICEDRARMSEDLLDTFAQSRPIFA
jgi:hypothetical protein